MLNHKLVALVALAGACDAPTGPRLLASNAQVAAVSSDDKYLAMLEQPTLSGSLWSGTLSVQPLPSGKPIVLDDSASRAQFSETGDVLVYGTAAPDGASSFLPRLWRPEFSWGVKVSDDLFTNIVVSRDGSALLLFDGQRLFAVRTDDCDKFGCMPVLLGNSVSYLVLARNGRYAVFALNDTPGTVEVRLYDFGAGQQRVVGGTSLALRQPADLSDDATRVLYTDGASVHVVTTDGGTELPWAQPPAKVSVQVVTFADAQTVLAIVVDATGTARLMRLTADSAQALGTAHDCAAVAGNTRVAFVAQNGFPGAGPSDLELMDLSSGTVTQMGAQVPRYPTISDDSKWAWFRDRYDQQTGTGTLTMIDLSTASATAVEFLPADTAVFVPGKSELYYLGGSGTTLERWRPGAARVDTVEPEVGNFAVSATGLYYTHTPDQATPQVYAWSLPR
jgi:hypothetical protein